MANYFLIHFVLIYKLHMWIYSNVDVQVQIKRRDGNLYANWYGNCVTQAGTNKVVEWAWSGLAKAWHLIQRHKHCGWAQANHNLISHLYHLRICNLKQSKQTFVNSPNTSLSWCSSTVGIDRDIIFWTWGLVKIVAIFQDIFLVCKSFVDCSICSLINAWMLWISSENNQNRPFGCWYSYSLQCTDSNSHCVLIPYLSLHRQIMFSDKCLHISCLPT